MNSRGENQHGLGPGDHLYFHHPARGPLAGQVLAAGKHGLTASCDQGLRHRVTWDRVLGAKSKATPQYSVVDQGIGGAILQDATGKRRFVAGEQVDDEPPAKKPEKSRDALLDGIDKIGKPKMLKALEAGAIVVFAKAGPIKNRPGLTLVSVTDAKGRTTKRWKKGDKEGSADKQKGGGDNPSTDKPRLEHGQAVKFKQGDVHGEGTITAAGEDGVTVKDAAGNEHRVHHHEIVHDDATASGDASEADNEPHDDASDLFPETLLENLPARVNQPVKDKAELYAKSGEALNHLKSWLDEGHGVCDKLGHETVTHGMGGVDWDRPGGMLFIAPLKGEERAAEKVQADYGGDWSQLRDVVRCSIAVDTMSDVRKTMQALHKSGLKLAMQPKNRFHKPTPVGYRDILMNVQFPNGIIGEVQLHLKGMLKAKEAGHEHYETMRTLEGKGEDAWSDEDRKAYAEAYDKSLEIYKGAWENPNGGKLKKAIGGDDMDASKYTYFDYDGATYRRKDSAGRVSKGVDEILKGAEWAPYTGDKLAPAMYGDEVDEPAKNTERGDEPMRKAAILLVMAK